jgi:hypothetical protein
MNLLIVAVLLALAGEQAQPRIIASNPDARFRYITDSGTGAEDGSDWSNACDGFTGSCAVGSLVRGRTYYIADGDYTGDGDLTFATATSGTQWIALRKATPSNHGTSVGWSNDMGDGVATFAAMAFDTSYWTLDGAVGGGVGAWTSGHGIAFTSAAGDATPFIDIGDTLSNFVIRHVKCSQTGNTEGTSTMASCLFNNGTMSDVLVEYLYADNLTGLPFFLRGGSRVIIQRSYTGNACGASKFDPGVHCEVLVIHTLGDMHFRWNFIAECPSSGGFVKNNAATDAEYVRIYGNVFVCPGTYGPDNTKVPIQCNAGTCTNWRIFNNTFVLMASGPLAGVTPMAGLLYYNNLAYNGGVITLRNTHGYNWFSSVTTSCTMNENATENVINNFSMGCDGVAEVSDPFVNSAGTTPEDFELTGELVGYPGTNVCALDPCTGDKNYNRDLFGVERGINGIWTIGALQRPQ